MKEENLLIRKQPKIEEVIKSSFGAPRSPQVFFENDINHRKVAEYNRKNGRRKN